MDINSQQWEAINKLCTLCIRQYGVQYYQIKVIANKTIQVIFYQDECRNTISLTAILREDMQWQFTSAKMQFDSIVVDDEVSNRCFNHLIKQIMNRCFI